MQSVIGTFRGLALAAVAVATVAFAEPAAAERSRCSDCGTVVTTNRKDHKGSGTAGTVVGGVGGAVAGNVVGHSTASTVIGGVGGALAGNVLERKMTTKKIWSVVVRMDRGGTRTVDLEHDPELHQGDRVRVADGDLQRL